MRRALVVLALLLVVPAAHADAPAGFREAPLLEPAASWAAQKSVKVYCGVTRVGDAYEAGYTNGAGGSDIFLTPSLVCAPLERLARRQRVVSRDAAAALLTLAHEAEHARGVADESEADCAALSITAEVGIRFFGLRGQRRYLRDMMRTAWQEHREAPAIYGRLC